MSWHYRVIRHKGANFSYSESGDWYAIHEAYADAKGRIWAITQEPVHVSSDTADGIRWVLEHMLKDLDKHPVLNEEDIPEKDAEAP